MQPDAAVTLQQLYQAVLVLASDEGDIEHRLRTAYLDHLQNVAATSLPSEIRNEWQSLQNDLKGLFGSTKPESVHASRAIDLAQRVLLVYDALIR